MNQKRYMRYFSILLSLMLFSALFLSACLPESDEAPIAEIEGVPSSPEEEIVVTEEPEDEPEEIIETEIVENAVPTGGVLHLVNIQEPDTLDPHKTAMSASAMICMLYGGSLLYVDHNNQIVPYHAQSWTISEDGLVYEFKIREDILFHNGTPLTAQDYVYTFQRATNPEIASPVAGGMLINVEKFEAIDDYTLRITLIEPKFTFLYDIASEYLMPLPQAAVEELGDQFGRLPIGTGPFIVKSWNTSEAVFLERNPDFVWAPQGYHQGPAYIDGIEVRLIPDPDTIMAGLEAGEIDSFDLKTQDIDRISESGFQIITGSYQGFGPGILINVTQPPLDDVRIRQAMNYAINRDAIVTIILQDKGTVQYGPLSPTQIGYWDGVEEIGQHYNLAKAEELILEAGYEKNADGIYEKDGIPLSFTALVPSGFTDWVKVLEIIENEYDKFGMHIIIQTLEVGVLLEQTFAGNFQLSLIGVGSREADILYDLFHSSNIGGGINLGMISNPELDALLANSRTETDSGERQALLNEAQRIIVEEAYVIPLYAADYYTAVNPRVHDLYISNGYTTYFDVYIKE